MRLSLPCLAFLASLSAGAPTAVAAPEPPARETTAARKPSSLDELFSRLAVAKDEAEAKGVANLIERRFQRSGSDTADLLMSRANDALQAKDAALAVELLDRVTQLRPDWAEAWNQRAAAFYQLDDPTQAIADLQQALTREPRHFSSWAALGHVELASGDKKRALAAYRHALKLHPFYERIKDAVDRLAPDIDGRDL